MLKACTANFEEADITVMSAAVADYTPVNRADQKIKKTSSEFNLELKKTTDILMSLGQQKTAQQIRWALHLKRRMRKRMPKKN